MLSRGSHQKARVHGQRAWEAHVHFEALREILRAKEALRMTNVESIGKEIEEAITADLD